MLIHQATYLDGSREVSPIDVADAWLVEGVEEDELLASISFSFTVVIRATKEVEDGIACY